MTNFLDAIQLGIQSAKDKDRNIQNILLIISRLKNSIEEFTEGKVTVRTVDKHEGLTLSLCTEDLHSEYKSASEELTIIDFGIDGYPCKIKIDNNQEIAHTNEGLEEYLTKLLSSAIVGSRLIKLINISNQPLTSEEKERKKRLDELKKITDLIG